MEQRYEDCKNNVNELEGFKDLQKEVGCPLDVVFRAVTYGIWTEDVSNRMIHMGVDLTANNYDMDLVLRSYDDNYRVLLRNYNRTWWLREDKSE